MEKKNVILLTVVAVATLLITVVGATFAYFAATVKGTEGAEEITIKAANDLTITYSDGATITGENILPGWGETYAKTGNEYEMTVVNNSENADITYTMKWNEVVNGITDKANLVFSADAKVEWNGEAALKATENNTAAVDPVSGDNQQFPNASATDDFVTQTLKPGEKATYTIKVAYKYSEEKQDSLGASFSGKIIIDEGKIQAKNHVPDPKD